MWLSVVTFFVAFIDVFCWPNGAPSGACITMTPSHGVSAQTTPAPYSITASATKYMPGDIIEVTVSGDTMQGFFIQARRANGDTASSAIGAFSLGTSTNLKTVTCGNMNANSITHSQRINAQSKTFKWTAPASDAGDVYFRGTIVKVKTTFWIGVASDTIMSAMTTSTSTTSTPHTMTTDTSTTRPSPAMANDTTTANITDCDGTTCSATSLVTSAFLYAVTGLMVLVRLAI